MSFLNDTFSRIALLIVLGGSCVAAEMPLTIVPPPPPMLRWNAVRGRSRILASNDAKTWHHYCETWVLYPTPELISIPAGTNRFYKLVSP